MVFWSKPCPKYAKNYHLSNVYNMYCYVIRTTLPFSDNKKWLRTTRNRVANPNIQGRLEAQLGPSGCPNIGDTSKAQKHIKPQRRSISLGRGRDTWCFFLVRWTHQRWQLNFTRSFCCQNLHGLDLSTCVQKKSFSKIWIVEATSFFYPTWKPTAHLSISLSVMIVPSDLLRLNLASFWWKIPLKLVEPSLNTRGSSSGTPSTWRTI